MINSLILTISLFSLLVQFGWTLQMKPSHFQKNLLKIHNNVNKSWFNSIIPSNKAIKTNRSIEYISFFESVVNEKRIPVKEVKEKLQEIVNEQIKFDSDAKYIAGKWELVMSTKIPNGYLPVYEICDFLEFSLTSR